MGVSMENQKRRIVRRRIFAVAAGGAALGVGVAATLAAWTDTEWVFGGNGAGGPGVGTSTFAIEQNTDPASIRPRGRTSRATLEARWSSARPGWWAPS